MSSAGLPAIFRYSTRWAARARSWPVASSSGVMPRGVNVASLRGRTSRDRDGVGEDVVGVLAVELDQGDDGVVAVGLLVGDEPVEPADHVIRDGRHRTGAVQQHVEVDHGRDAVGSGIVGSGRDVSDGGQGRPLVVEGRRVAATLGDESVPTEMGHMVPRSCSDAGRPGVRGRQAVPDRSSASRSATGRNPFETPRPSASCRASSARRRSPARTHSSAHRSHHGTRR